MSSPPRDDDQLIVTTKGEVSEAARSYAESFRQAQDTLGTFVHETAGALGSLKSWLDGTFRRGE